MVPNTTRRPRVAAIGLDESQIESISPLCGDLRKAASVKFYRDSFDWTETDMTVLGDDQFQPIRVRGHVLAISPSTFNWSSSDGEGLRSRGAVGVDRNNRERELSVSTTCPERYRGLAAELILQLRNPPAPLPSLETFEFSAECVTPLVETTSGQPVAVRCMVENQLNASEARKEIILALPAEARLEGWFRAFLAEVHDVDPIRVPQPPPRIENLWDWHTPTERELATRIADISDAITGLEAEQQRVAGRLVATSRSVNEDGMRRSIWTDGDELVESVGEILDALGFAVRNMDAERAQGELKREDLRLTLAGRPGWEAIAEVKGYTGGTKTNDSRQIREHRDHYIAEEQRIPDQTLWIANTYRRMEPSVRRAPESSVGESAVVVDAVHLLTTDLYRLWARVQRGEMKQEHAVQQLLDAAPGLWSLDALDSDTPT